MVYVTLPNGGKSAYLNVTFINPYILGIIVAPYGPLNHRNLRNSNPRGHTTKALYTARVYALE